MRLLLCLAAALLLVPAAASAVTLDGDALAARLAPQMKNELFQAVSVAVLTAEGEASAHLGTLAPGSQRAPDDRTLYEIGSISKVFTSLLLADAVVRGEVTLDTPLASLLPEGFVFADPSARAITLRMLATHSSGIPRLPAELDATAFGNPYARYSDADLLRSLGGMKLDFPPGTGAGYSNFAAGALATGLARRAGLSYAELLARRITRPLGMDDTVVELSAEQRARFAPAFASAGEPVAHWDFQSLAGAGGIRSTLADLRRFAAALLHPEKSPLAAAIELAWAKQPLEKTLDGGGQALGWMIAQDGETRWHNGMTGGFHAAIFVNRRLGVASILLANRSAAIGSTIAEGLLRYAAGAAERPIPNGDRQEVALTDAELDRCVGTYRLSPQLALAIERRNRHLFVTPSGQPADMLYAASPVTFFSRRVAAEVTFDLPANGGSATALTLEQGGRHMRASRE
ncbi:MAG TPA: serine hydrolase [Thermoanaerobaculia bacterium]|jgi:CubicO group peptidase (beta-lactamase class C family)|nr:serine hydrolase [Thermoanaerobaculia bacterium]